MIQVTAATAGLCPTPLQQQQTLLAAHLKILNNEYAPDRCPIAALGLAMHIHACGQLDTPLAGLRSQGVKMLFYVPCFRF